VWSADLKINRGIVRINKVFEGEHGTSLELTYPIAGMEPGDYLLPKEICQPLIDLAVRIEHLDGSNWINLERRSTRTY